MTSTGPAAASLAIRTPPIGASHATKDDRGMSYVSGLETLELLRSLSGSVLFDEGRLAVEMLGPFLATDDRRAAAHRGRARAFDRDEACGVARADETPLGDFA